MNVRLSQIKDKGPIGFPKEWRESKKRKNRNNKLIMNDKK